MSQICGLFTECCSISNPHKLMEVAKASVRAEHQWYICTVKVHINRRIDDTDKKLYTFCCNLYGTCELSHVKQTK